MADDYTAQLVEREVYIVEVEIGIKGDNGEAATIAIGTVTTVPYNAPATVQNSGTAQDAVFDFEIPQGLPGTDGDDGLAATISVGSVTSVPNTNPATVTNSGTPSAAVFNFEIPAGAPGTPIELQATSTHLQWRYVGALTWNNLIAISDIIKSVSASGTVIDFNGQKVYNSNGIPGTGNITGNLTGAVLGIVQKIYHSSNPAPTFPGTWVKVGSNNYAPGQLNIIYAEWAGGSRVEYWIAQ